MENEKKSSLFPLFLLELVGEWWPEKGWREKGRKKQQHMIWAGRISLQSISKKSFIDNKHKISEETCFLWQTSYLYYWKLMEKARKCVYNKKITHFLLDLMNPVYQSISSWLAFFLFFQPCFLFYLLSFSISATLFPYFLSNCVHVWSPFFLSRFTFPLLRFSF